MKKIVSFALSVALIGGLFSCSKVNPDKTGNNPLYTETTAPLNPSDPLYTVGRVPLSFTKKGIIEEVTGEWCGNCPDGAAKMKELIEMYPDKVYGVAFHAANSDPFEISGAYNGLLNTVFPAGTPGTIGFPSASVNRRETVSLPDYLGGSFDYRDVWANQMIPVLKSTATCGLALVAEEANDVLDLDVYVGYNKAITSNTNITVYIIEDDVQESAVGAQVSGGGTASNPYVHQHILRKVLTPSTGNSITLNNTTDRYNKIQFHGVDLKGLYHKKDNIKIIALVNVTGSTAKELDVLNVQEVALDEVKKWD